MKAQAAAVAVEADMVAAEAVVDGHQAEVEAAVVDMDTVDPVAK